MDNQIFTDDQLINSFETDVRFQKQVTDSLFEVLCKKQDLKKEIAILDDQFSNAEKFVCAAMMQNKIDILHGKLILAKHFKSYYLKPLKIEEIVK